MKPGYHIAFSSLVSGILYMITRSWAISVSSLLAGIFIDLDHIYDVLREHGRPFTVERFLRTCYTGDFNKIILVLHGWEYILFTLAAAWLTHWDPFIVGICIGLSHHMILDALHNSPSFWSYSILWRWKNGFYYDEIFGARLPRRKPGAWQPLPVRSVTYPGFMIKLLNLIQRMY